MRRLLVSVGASVAVLVGFLFVLGPSRLADQLAGAHVGVFALGLVAVVAALGCWSEASRRLFAAFGTPISRRRAFVAYGAGAFGKQVLPMGNAGGPAVMAYAFDRETDLGYSRTLAVIVVAEFLSLVASLVLGVAGIALLVSFGSAGSGLRWIGLGVLLIAAVLTALSVVVWYRRRHVAMAVDGIARLVCPVVGRLSSRLADRLRPERVDDGLRRYYATFDAVMADRRAVLYAFVLTQLGWVLFALPLYTGALALDVRLSPALVVFLVPTAGLATVVPLPGGLGGVEVVLAWLLASLAGIDLVTAGAVVVLYRLCSFWFFVLVAGISASVAAVGVGELPAALEVPPRIGRGDEPVMDVRDESSG
jgi:uncharacterized protein (TIRG00374 family)